MSTDKGMRTGKDQTGERQRTQDDRQKRLAAALRDNLRRRKDRKRDRDGEAADGDAADGDAAGNGVDGTD